MVGLKTFCQLAYGGPLAIRKPAYVQQQLVLEMGDAMEVRRLFAEAQKTPQLIAEMGKRLEVLFAQSGLGILSVPGLSSAGIISCCDIYKSRSSVPGRSVSLQYPIADGRHIDHKRFT